MSAVRKALTSAFHPCPLLVAALLGTSPASAAPVSVSDSGGGRVQVEAHDASLGQVLAALQESHLIEFSASEPLSGTVTGTYTGTLSHVLSRILNGYNYFLHVTASGTELHVVNVASGDTNAALWHEVGSNVDAAAAPAPAPLFVFRRQIPFRRRGRLRAGARSSRPRRRLSPPSRSAGPRRD
jgi:hypothetical protein